MHVCSLWVCFVQFNAQDKDGGSEEHKDGVIEVKEKEKEKDDLKLHTDFCKAALQK